MIAEIARVLAPEGLLDPLRAEPGRVLGEARPTAIPSTSMSRGRAEIDEMLAQRFPRAAGIASGAISARRCGPRTGALRDFEAWQGSETGAERAPLPDAMYALVIAAPSVTAVCAGRRRRAVAVLRRDRVGARAHGCECLRSAAPRRAPRAARRGARVVDPAVRGGGQHVGELEAAIAGRDASVEAANAQAVAAMAEATAARNDVAELEAVRDVIATERDGAREEVAEALLRARDDAKTALGSARQAADALREENERLERAIAAQERIIAYRQTLRWWLALPWIRVRALVRRLRRMTEAAQPHYVIDVVVPVYNAPDDVRTCVDERAGALAARRSRRAHRRRVARSAHPPLFDGLRRDARIRSSCCCATTTTWASRAPPIAACSCRARTCCCSTPTPSSAPDGSMRSCIARRPIRASARSRRSRTTPRSARSRDSARTIRGPPAPIRGRSHASLAAAAVPVYPDLPTGVGFCLYLRRALLDDDRLLRRAAFGAGYGEENDLCLRAAKAGWRNVLADNAFVVHTGGRSFAGQQGGGRAAQHGRAARAPSALHGHGARVHRRRSAAARCASSRRCAWRSTPRRRAACCTSCTTTAAAPSRTCAR